MTGEQPAQSNREFAGGLARAFAGAIIFAFPLLMTMEMWWLGFYLNPLRLLLFMVLTLVLLVPLSRLVGFEETHTWAQDILDAFTAYGVAIVASALMLAVLSIITTAMPSSEILGKIAIQSVPASIGAIIARGQLGGSGGGGSGRDGNGGGDSAKRGGGDGKQQGGPSYNSELLLMTVGALFLALNVAPTEEMILIAFKMTPWHALALIILSIVALHAFVYALGFAGQEEFPEGMNKWTGLLTYSVAGFGIAILVSLYSLWTFGRTDGASATQIAMMVSVLCFPSALGAGSARLIV